MTRFASTLSRTLLGAGAALALVGPSSAEAQVGTQSNAVTVALTATKNATISLTAASSALALTGGIVDNSNANQFPPLNVTLDWTLLSGSSLQLVGWFGTGTQALANGTNFIPSSRVEGKLSTAATWSPFSGAAVGGTGVAGSSLVLENIALSAANLTSTATRTVDLRLNLAGAPNTVAGDYTGTLNLRAVVQ